CPHDRGDPRGVQPVRLPRHPRLDRRADPRRQRARRSRRLHPDLQKALMMSAYLELLPAADVKDGRAVQLVQGIDGSEKVFGDPIEAALRWQEMGAEWIHLVDL